MCGRRQRRNLAAGHLSNAMADPLSNTNLISIIRLRRAAMQSSNQIKLEMQSWLQTAILDRPHF